MSAAPNEKGRRRTAHVQNTAPAPRRQARTAVGSDVIRSKHGSETAWRRKGARRRGLSAPTSPPRLRPSRRRRAGGASQVRLRSALSRSRERAQASARQLGARGRPGRRGALAPPGGAAVCPFLSNGGVLPWFSFGGARRGGPPQAPLLLLSFLRFPPSPQLGMEELAQQRRYLSGAQKRKPARPAPEAPHKLPRAACSLLLAGPEATGPEMELELDGPSRRNGEDCPLSGGALDLSVTRHAQQALLPEPPRAPDQEDIGLLDRWRLTEGQKRAILASRWVPPSNFQFPKRLMGSGASQKYRRCSAQLLQDYQFARYSRHLDGVFCGPCFVFNSNKETVLVSTPLKDWSNGKKILERHSRSKEHGRAAVKTEAFVAYELKKKLSERGQLALKRMVKLILLCGRHDILLGLGPTVTKTLDTLSRYMAELDPLLQENLSSGSCATRQSSERTQEELIKLIGLQIQSKVLARVRDAKFFGLIIGGSSERSGSLSLSLRYVHRPSEGPVEIREDPVDFIEAPGAAESLPELFLQRMTAWGLQKELLRAYSYRGPGPHGGQRTRICTLLPGAICSASVHQLPAAVLYSCDLRPVTKLLGTLSKISPVLRSSAELLSPGLLAPRAFLDVSSYPGEGDDAPEEVRGRAGPRHPHLADVLRAFRDEYPAILNALQKAAENCGDAESLFYSVTKFDFLVTLVSVEFILSCTKSLPLDVQQLDPDLLHLSAEANLILQRLRKMKEKDDPGFEVLYDDVKLLAASVGVEESPPLICGRPVSPDAFSTQDLREGYRTSLFNPFLDHVMSELQEQLLVGSPRFLAQYLIPDKLPLLESQEAEAALCDAFQGDLPSLDSFHLELQRWRANWTEVPREEWPSSLLSALQHLNPVCFPSVNVALSVLATMPISVPSGEQASQALERARMWQRNPGKASQLPGLALMSIHQDIEVDVDQVLRGLHLFTL
ncbi:52 kDa repressor of the inhibitor of the protein kinase-like [Sminthopsis crassicaudata]|uniref:52 kDa repressor of the inhibitor of the protein kinase-like n=1 Tax=Sminthopsis crassicaudata TaxID=9301 RepID=UPI003D69D27C